LKAWPGLSHWFGITPLNFQDLTVPELAGYLDELRKIDAEARKR
jgi:hypothetical protein